MRRSYSHDIETDVCDVRAAAQMWFLSTFVLTGCASVGPSMIVRDRFDYDLAVTMSWKRMMLLNMVKLRYGDTPMFLDVASVISSYTLEGQVSLGGTLATSPGPSSGTVGGSAHFADKPTITYNPLLGERFTRSLMTPISPGVVVSLIQSGWSADTVTQLMVTSINGIQNRFGGGARARGAEPKFQKVGATLRRLQASGKVGMRVEKVGEHEWTVLTLQRTDVTPEVKEDVRNLRELLGLGLDVNEIRVVYGAAPKDNTEVAMVTRSYLEILFDTAASIDVPEAHVKDGRAPATAVFDTDVVVGYQPLIRIQSGRSAPDNAFVSVRYGDCWYWIDTRDYRSKSLFSFLMIVSSLSETGPAKAQPVVTIPTG